METVTIIVFGSVCFVAGMYVTTQIGSWIDSRTQNKKFIKNLNEYDKKQKKD